MIEPSKPASMTVKVKVLFEFCSFRLKYPPHGEMGRVGHAVAVQNGDLAGLGECCPHLVTRRRERDVIHHGTGRVFGDYVGPVHGFGPVKPTSKTPWVTSAMVTM